MSRIALLLTLLFVLTGCGSQSAPPAPTATPFPRVATSIPRPMNAAERGLILFQKMQPKVGFACITCHYVHSDARLIGPGLGGLKDRAPEYMPADTIEEYIRQSILYPDDFLAPGNPAYPPRIMPRRYSEVFSEQELEDLVAYVMSL